MQHTLVFLRIIKSYFLDDRKLDKINLEIGNAIDFIDFNISSCIIYLYSTVIILTEKILTSWKIYRYTFKRKYLFFSVIMFSEHRQQNDQMGEKAAFEILELYDLHKLRHLS